VTSTRFLPTFLAGFCLSACGERVPATEPATASEPLLSPASGSTPAPRSVAESSPNPADANPCPRETALISDGENGPNRTNAIEGRGGYWYTYSDDDGSEVLPLSGEKGGTFTMTNGGANGTAHAARMTGTIGTGQDIFAGMGLSFVDPKGEYDARKYRGISFWAKRGTPDSTRNVRLKLPDRDTDPLGKVCTQCYNDFGAYLELTDDWKKYTITFASMKQESDWGKPRPPALATRELYGIQFQVYDYGKKFDILVDEIEFTGCAP
jgi:endoglucanase